MASSVCRVCLVGNIRMLNIHNTNLQEMYEKLTNTKLHTEGETGMPSTVCYVCHRQLQRCYTFCHVAHKSNKILQDMLKNGTEVTHNAATTLSCKMHNLSMHMSDMSAQHMSINIYSNTRSTPDTVKEEQVLVKEEQLDETDDNHIEEMKLKTEVTHSAVTTMHNLSMIPAQQMSINIYSNTPVTVKEEQVLVKEEEQSDETDDIDTEMKLETLDEDVETGNISKNSEPTLKSEDNLSYNRNTMHSCFYCDVCNKQMASKLQLIKHLQCHTREKPYSCHVCDKSFTQKNHLTRHMLVHTGEKPYSCNRCDKAFARKSHLTSHMLVHTGEKPYSCNICDKAFTKKSHLTKHMLVHTGEKPYSCNRCDKAFTHKSNLTTHMLVHTGEKVYSCNRCAKAFTQKSHLTTHMLVHTGEKPYSCNRCKKAFSLKSTLTRHTLVHTGEKPHSCNICDKGFTHKSNLTRHNMLVHTGEKAYT